MLEIPIEHDFEGYPARSEWQELLQKAVLDRLQEREELLNQEQLAQGIRVSVERITVGIRGLQLARLVPLVLEAIDYAIPVANQAASDLRQAEQDDAESKRNARESDRREVDAALENWARENPPKDP